MQKGGYSLRFDQAKMAGVVEAHYGEEGKYQGSVQLEVEAGALVLAGLDALKAKYASNATVVGIIDAMEAEIKAHEAAAAQAPQA